MEVRARVYFREGGREGGRGEAGGVFTLIPMDRYRHKRNGFLLFVVIWVAPLVM